MMKHSAQQRLNVLITNIIVLQKTHALNVLMVKSEIPN